MNPTPSDGRHIAASEIPLLSWKVWESVMGHALSKLSLIAMLVFSLAITATWAAVLGYGLFGFGEWALAILPELSSTVQAASH
jgi:hypothetical protein